MVEYKLIPVKRPLSHKIINEKGPSEKLFKTSANLGMISKEELETILKIKNGIQLAESDEKTQIVLKKLLKKRIVEKIT
ncbi:MAG: hypothetical protein JW891_04705 [Candidatus Lokiarchaeota archaeon]|nr:hypothetical protein [Candidatus Lokiarchaeota archaeon]